MEITTVRKITYYMEESVLLAIKPLVDSIRHYIRDPSAYFPYVTIPAFFIKPSRICKTWLLWNTIKSEIFNI